jgi:hypothetical protein
MSRSRWAAGFVLADLRSDPQILVHAQAGEGAAPFRYMAYAEAHDVFGCLAADRFAVEADAAVRPHHPADRTQRGGFAGAVGAQQRDRRRPAPEKN